MSLLKVKDHSTLRRDDTTGAIVQVDNAEWGKHKMRAVEKQIARERDEKIKSLEGKIENLTEIVEKLCEPKPTLFQRLQSRFSRKNTTKGTGGQGKTDLD